MRYPRVSAIVVAAALLPVAFASPSFYYYYDGLAAELQSRRDNNYEGELSKEQKGELKAITKSLAAMEDPLEDQGDAIKVLKKVDKALEKGFPGEFSDVGLPTNLNSLMYNILQNLAAEISSLRSNAAETASGISDEGLAAKAQAALDASGEGLDEYYENQSDYPTALKGLATAWKFLEKAQKFIDKASAPK